MADAKHSNGRLFRILTGSPCRINKQYSVGSRAVTAGAIGGPRGDPRRRSQQKAAAAPNELPRPIFRNKKSQSPYLQTRVVSPHLSSSPGLRINGSASPSQVSPMTGFRLMQNLHTYSGGTVRDSHPVFYSPAGLLPPPQALKRNIYLRL